MTKLSLVGILTVAFLFFPILSFANGGNIRLAGNKYFVNLSSSPMTPQAGTKTAMLISFAHIADNRVISSDIRAWIEIRKKVSGETVFPKTEYKVSGGILEFPFVYPEPGLHEIFVSFEKSDELGTIYQAQDFLVDVQSAPAKNTPPFLPYAILLAGMAMLSSLFGFALGQKGKSAFDTFWKR